MNHLVKNMIARLLSRDFAGMRDILAMATKELEKAHGPSQQPKVKRGREGLETLRSDLDALLQEPGTALADQQKEKLRDLSHRESNLRDRADELHAKLESLFQLFPSLDPKIVRNLKQAEAAMGAAQGRLNALDGPNAVPPERQALDLLSEAQQQAQASMEQLAQRGQLGRMPAPYVFRMGRFSPSGRLIPLPGMPQFPQFDMEGGMSGIDLERFKLPGTDDYKVPRSFREEVLESLKQGIPPQLKEQIEAYFKNLTE
jgi:DNA repair exonuclease SbcCD ATPase subunit